MKHILNQLKRDRTYSTHERWGVFAALGVLTILVSAGGWFLFGQPAASAATLTVAGATLPQDTISADGQTSGQTVLTIINEIDNQPAAGVWVGLLITNPVQRTPALTHFDWYSAEPGRAFYQTDANGQVTFELMSTIPGEIEYQVYAANPELKNDNKYQDLEYQFTARFE